MPVSPLCSVGAICDHVVVPKGMFFMSISVSSTLHSY
jgi:hypothetical protein